MERKMYMKINKFDVVELKNGNRATILDINEKNNYFVEIVNAYGITIEKNKIINVREVNRVIYVNKLNK